MRLFRFTYTVTAGDGQSARQSLDVPAQSAALALIRFWLTPQPAGVAVSAVEWAEIVQVEVTLSVDLPTYRPAPPAPALADLVIMEL